MSVLHGPRLEKRLIKLQDKAAWATALDSGTLRLEDGTEIHTEEATHLAPCLPTKIICPHLTYQSRGIESRNKPHPTPEPTYFMKPITALNHHKGEIFRPEDCRYLNYEGEFAAIIGKETRDITPEEAWNHIAGFAPALDMGIHDFRDTDSGSMLRVKGGDGMCPIGPGIVSGVDPRKQTLRTYRNGELVQEANIEEELIWGPDYMIADLARHITLMPGDIVLTGTPCHSRSLEVGDIIEVEVTGLGRLSCNISSRPSPKAEAGHQPTNSDEVRRVAFGNDDRVPKHFKENYRRAGRLLREEKPQ